MKTLIPNRSTSHQVNQLLKKMNKEEKVEMLHRLEKKFYGKRKWTWEELRIWGQRRGKEMGVTEEDIIDYIMELRYGKKK